MHKKYFWVAFLAALFISIGSFVYAQTPSNQGVVNVSFDFALIGDLPYDAEQEAKFPNIIKEINRSPLAFIVHDGDIKSGSTLCSDEMFGERKALFQQFEHPFILVPGDNEWTDCHRQNNGSYDPIERLAKLREVFYQGNETLGKRSLTLTRQSDNSQYRQFRENVRWIYGDAMFAGLNIPGSNNNFGRSPEADAEYSQRNAANLAWMRESFALAKRNNNRGVMLIIQANPGFELEATNKDRTGYNDFLAALQTETLGFLKPVVLVHGDSHYFRLDKPLLNSKNQRRIENFTRVETFGSPDAHWLRASVNPKDKNVFSFTQEVIRENLVEHQ